MARDAETQTEAHGAQPGPPETCDQPAAEARRGAGLLLFDCPDPAALRALLARIPPEAGARIAQVVVVLVNPFEIADPPAVPGGPVVVVHRNPRELGYGGARKAAFEHALREGLDPVIVMRGDGEHPPEQLPGLLDTAAAHPDDLVFAARYAEGPAQMRRPLRERGGRLATWLQNRTLGLSLRDHHSGYRLYPAAFLRAAPFQADANDRLFDVQILLQARAAGLDVHDSPVTAVWREDATGGEGVLHALRAFGTAVGYRLHQLHVIRRGRYFVEREVHYTFKPSPASSHLQIVDAIPSGSRVLDLGCSQGLLARPLAEKGVRVTGVDARPPEHLARELDAYHQRDLEQPLELPVGREFDVVVVSDVIEHLRSRRQLLRAARRYLKEDGLLIISTPNIAIWFYRLSLLVGRFEYGPRGVLDETHVHLFTRASFRREVERAGYRIRRERVTALPFEVVFESTGRSRLVRAVGATYHALARLWPGLLAYQFILEAEIITLDEEASEGP